MRLLILNPTADLNCKGVHLSSFERFMIYRYMFRLFAYNMFLNISTHEHASVLVTSQAQITLCIKAIYEGSNPICISRKDFAFYHAAQTFLRTNISLYLSRKLSLTILNKLEMNVFNFQRLFASLLGAFSVKVLINLR